MIVIPLRGHLRAGHIITRDCRAWDAVMRYLLPSSCPAVAPKDPPAEVEMAAPRLSIPSVSSQVPVERIPPRPRRLEVVYVRAMLVVHGTDYIPDGRSVHLAVQMDCRFGTLMMIKPVCGRPGHLCGVLWCGLLWCVRWWGGVGWVGLGWVKASSGPPGPRTSPFPARHNWSGGCSVVRSQGLPD